MQNKKIILTLGVLVGAFLIFLFPLFPVALPNSEGTFGGFWWISGLMQIGLSLKSFFLIELTGSIIGFLTAFIYVGGFD